MEPAALRVHSDVPMTCILLTRPREPYLNFLRALTMRERPCEMGPRQTRALNTNTCLMSHIIGQRASFARSWVFAVVQYCLQMPFKSDL
jgi:hypothetical protein